MEIKKAYCKDFYRWLKGKFKEKVDNKKELIIYCEIGENYIMTSIIYLLTILFAIGCFIIIKNKRYKKMPFISSIVFFAFIGFGLLSILYLVLPYGEFLVYPFSAIILGILFTMVGINDLYSIWRCKEEVKGIFCGYNTYYGGSGIFTQAPVFEYIYKGIHYFEQSSQNVSYKQLNYRMAQGNIYTIYIDSKYPAVFILTKRIKIISIIEIIFGLIFL